MGKRHYPVIVEQDQDGVFIVTCPVFERLGQNAPSFSHLPCEPV